jgi:hypothetical protein
MCQARFVLDCEELDMSSAVITVTITVIYLKRETRADYLVTLNLINKLSQHMFTSILSYYKIIYTWATIRVEISHFFSVPPCKRSRDSSVGIATGYGPNDRRV